MLLRFMAHAPASDGPRYSYAAVTKEIGRVVEPMKRGTKKRLAAAAKMSASDFRHRMTEYRNERFSFEEIGAIAEELDAPPGWPWLKWETAEAVESHRKALLLISAAAR